MYKHIRMTVLGSHKMNVTTIENKKIFREEMSSMRTAKFELNLLMTCNPLVGNSRGESRKNSSIATHLPSMVWESKRL